MGARRSRFPPPRAPVSLRDGIVAIAELNPVDAEAENAILDLLGLARPSPVVPPKPPVDQPRVDIPLVKRDPPPLPPLGPTATTQPPSAEPLPARIEPKPPVPSPQPAWATPGPALPRAREAGKPVAPLPGILAPLEGRGIYTAALSTRVDEGEPDLDRAVEELANYRPLRELPRLPLRTLRRGVQVLLDTGPSMAPYAADVHGLADELATLLSGSQMERWYFMRCPTRGVREGLRARGRAWPVPPRGMPVLAVSDFGIADNLDDEEAATIAEWRRFAADVRAEGHLLIGLVPFSPGRWPEALAEEITLIHWSERTIAASVDRAVRDAERRLS
jgi:hypothetical protein